VNSKSVLLLTKHMAFNKIFTVGEWASILLHGALRRSFQAEGWSATSKMYRRCTRFVKQILYINVIEWWLQAKEMTG